MLQYSLVNSYKTSHTLCIKYIMMVHIIICLLCVSAMVDFEQNTKMLVLVLVTVSMALFRTTWVCLKLVLFYSSDNFCYM